jgi:hypothetical protein
MVLITLVALVVCGQTMDLPWVVGMGLTVAGVLVFLKCNGALRA